MLISAKNKCVCNECGTSIQKGERISWIEHLGSFHISCTPSSIDRSSAHRENDAALKKESLNTNSTLNLFSNEQKAIATAVLIAEILLVGAIFSVHSNGYYDLLRLVVCGLSIFLSVRLYKDEFPTISVLLGFAAIIFNPIIQLHLPHNVWQVIDSAQFVMLAVASYQIFRTSRKTSKVT